MLTIRHDDRSLIPSSSHPPIRGPTPFSYPYIYHTAKCQQRSTSLTEFPHITALLTILLYFILIDDPTRPIQPQDATREDTSMQDIPTSHGDGAGGGDAGKAPRKRPRLDLAVDSRERKRGKTMFGLVLGTLNRAKNEDKARNASDAVCFPSLVPNSCVWRLSDDSRYLILICGLGGTIRQRRGS